MEPLIGTLEALCSRPRQYTQQVTTYHATPAVLPFTPRPNSTCANDSAIGGCTIADLHVKLQVKRPRALRAPTCRVPLNRRSGWVYGSLPWSVRLHANTREQFLPIPASPAPLSSPTPPSAQNNGRGGDRSDIQTSLVPPSRILL